MRRRRPHPPLSPVAVIAAVLGGLFAAGCSLSRAYNESRLIAGGEYDVVTGLDVPDVVGPAGCGAQALAAVLAWSEPSVDAQTLADELPWHDLGATPVDLLVEARRRGHAAKIARGDWIGIVEVARAGSPVLVMIDAGVEVPTLTGHIPSTPLMHWGVVSGAARDDTSILLAAPQRRHHVVGRDEFMRRWIDSDYCQITVGPRSPDDPRGAPAADHRPAAPDA